MEQQEWIDGAFEETDTDYTIAGMNILYKKETEYLKKGVKREPDPTDPTDPMDHGYVLINLGSLFERKKECKFLVPNKI